MINKSNNWRPIDNSKFVIQDGTQTSSKPSHTKDNRNAETGRRSLCDKPGVLVTLWVLLRAINNKWTFQVICIATFFCRFPSQSVWIVDFSTALLHGQIRCSNWLLMFYFLNRTDWSIALDYHILCGSIRFARNLWSFWLGVAPKDTWLSVPIWLFQELDPFRNMARAREAAGYQGRFGKTRPAHPEIDKHFRICIDMPELACDLAKEAAIRSTNIDPYTRKPVKLKCGNKISRGGRFTVFISAFWAHALCDHCLDKVYYF